MVVSALFFLLLNQARITSKRKEVFSFLLYLNYKLKYPNGV